MGYLPMVVLSTITAAKSTRDLT
ncbi:UNVERIFIED_CONTAM: hypothetical protein GTU68_009079 [Idotea baltica]|nr:hypothetical protein [Idotea baltica]